MDIDDTIEALMKKMEEAEVKLSNRLLTELQAATPSQYPNIRNGWEITSDGASMTISNSAPEAYAVDNGTLTMPQAGITEAVLLNFDTYLEESLK